MSQRNLVRLLDCGPLELWQDSFNGTRLDVLCLGDAILGASINGLPTRVEITDYKSWSIFPLDACGREDIVSEIFVLHKTATEWSAYQSKSFRNLIGG